MGSCGRDIILRAAHVFDVYGATLYGCKTTRAAPRLRALSVQEPTC
jgi:hypothetical protein